jgi:membrane dipeptidase
MTVTQAYPTFIGHIDTLLRLYELEHSETPVSIEAESQKIVQAFFEHGQDGHVDVPRAKIGGMAGALFAVFVPSPRDCTPTPSTNTGGASTSERSIECYLRSAIEYGYAQQAALKMISYLLRLEAGAEGRFKVVRSADELEQAIRGDVLAGVLHIEGAEMIDPQLYTLDVLYQAGLRSLGPVWSRPNIFGHGVPFMFGQSPDTGPGLTDAGKALVRACNRLGILLDLSHLNEQGFWDVAKLSTAPLVATHSNAHAICPSARNLTDKQLAAIKESDGLVGINFNVSDLRVDGQRESDTPLEDVVRHIDYLVEHIGIERVALGTDYDGAQMPNVLHDVSTLPGLYAALAAHGYDDNALKKIAFENWLRVLRLTWHA